MIGSPVARRVAGFTALLGWAALAAWAFSLGHSESYFQYNLASRLPPFLAALAGAIAIPLSVRFQLQRVARGRSTPLRAWLAHLGGSVAAVVPLGVTAAVLARVPGPMHLSADDAMGVGINVLLLVAVAIVSALVLAAVLWLRRKAVSAAA